MITFMKRLTLSLFFVLPVTVFAQLTPEAIIEQFPELPSAPALAAHGDVVDNFKNVLTATRQRAREMIDAAEADKKGNVEAFTKDAEKMVQERTGKSVDQLQNMSAEELQATANSLVSQQMGSLGMGNISLDDLQKLEGKSEQEIMAAFAPQGMNIGSNTATLAGVNEQGQKRSEISAEMDKILKTWRSVTELNNKDSLDTAGQINALWKSKYADYYRQSFDQQRKLLDVGGDSEAIAALGKRMEEIRGAFNVDAFSLWRSLISRGQERIKSTLADAPRMDTLQEQYNKLSLEEQGMQAKYANLTVPNNGMEIAIQYLDWSEKVLFFPEVVY